MIKTRFFFLSLLSALVLLSSITYAVGASDLSAINKPTATVTAVVVNCKLEEGWCTKDTYIIITGDDPTFTILAIDGLSNGKDFHYEGKVCLIPLNSGFNNLVYWSVSSSGQISDKKILNINLTANMSRSLSILDLPKTTMTSSLAGRGLRLDLSITQRKDLPDDRLSNQMELSYTNANRPIRTLLDFGDSSSLVIHSPIDEKTIPLTEGEKSGRQFNIYQLILLSKDSLSPFQIDAEAKNNSSTDAFIPTVKEKPSVQENEEIAKKTSKISVDIFNTVLKRNIYWQKKNSNLQNKGEEFNLVLDTLPTNLSILTQQSISGNLTFEGTAYDSVSGIESLMVNLGQGWRPLHLEKDRWIYQWNIEKAGISSGVFDLQVRVKDYAGNEKIQTQRFTVINRIWPVLTLCGLLLALGFTALVDPRRKGWRELAQTTAKAIQVNALKTGRENR